MNFCTIIAKNYIAHARVLARSLAESNPGSRMWTLIVDELSDHIDPSHEPFHVLRPDQIGCEPFTHMALRYSVLELSTAVKPWLLRYLMAETDGPVTYLDPDIKVYGSLARLDDLASRHGLVLIPHNSNPIPPDGRRPSQVDVMIAGVYNLGYVSLAPRPEMDQLLDWWADRLTRDCRVDPIWGYFVDQRWFDLAPGFVSDLAIVRDPEYNVAYWNLHDRRLESDSGRYLVDGRPLAFFHFSGFDPEHPLVLSRHQDRVDVLENPVLEQLLAEYAASVMAEGHAVSRQWPYSYGALGDGTRLDDRLRRLYDDFADEHDGAVASPFTVDGVRAFDRWLTTQAPGSPPGISRAIARIYEERPDLQAAYPDLNGIDRAGLLLWAEGPGRQEESLLDRLMANGPGAQIEPATSPDPRLDAPSVAGEPSAALREGPWGVNVIGDFRFDGGMGHVARKVVEALDAVGISVIPTLSQPTLSGQALAYSAVTPEDAPFSVNVICLSPDVLPEFVKHAGAEFFAGRYSVGLWYSERERVPEGWRAIGSLIEEVWVPSTYVAEALEQVVSVPVNKIRAPVRPFPLESRSRATFGLSNEEFAFHFSFDYRDGFERKNPLAVVEAFRSAFVEDERACLILSCANADHDPTSHARLHKAAAAHPNVRILDRDVSLSVTSSLTALTDCYVSLHRSEAFGEQMADAMWFGKPVVATGYSGNLDFMASRNSHLVDHRLVPRGQDSRSAEGVWAEPDVAHAAALMRLVFDDRVAAAELGATAAEDIRRTHSPEIAGEVLYRRLESVRGIGRARRGANPIGGRPQALATVSLRMRHGPQAPVGGRGGSAREWIRKAILRVMRPYTVYQQMVDSEVTAALDELSDNAANLRERAATERAKRMSETRAMELQASMLETRTRGLDDIKRGTDDIKRGTHVIESQVAEIKEILTLQTDRGVYLSLAELRRRHATVGAEPGEVAETLDITPYELRVFSQNGEDGVLAEVLRRVGAPARYFVEFGVESGREGNCVYLADVAGWRGLFMEAGDEFFKLLERKYAAAARISTMGAMVSPENVEHLFEQAGVPREPDVVSIDVDGQDYWIWEAIEGYRPRVVVIEYNSALDPRRRLVQPNDETWTWDGTEYYGASVGALQALGERKGYCLVHTDLSGVNAFFVRSDLFADAFPEPDALAVRGVPNYYQSGYRHPVAKSGSRYLDLDSGELVTDVH